jgi:hypothetical protein
LNNQLSLEPRENPFETLRLHDQSLKSFISSKPFIAQSRLFSTNSLLVSSQAYKSVNSGIKKHQEQYPLDFSSSLIRLRNELPPVSDSMFAKKLAAVVHRDETDVAAALLLIQLQCQEGNTQLGAATLERLLHALKEKLDIKYAPGLVSLAAVLLPKVEREDKATSLMMEAKEYWSNKKNAVCPCLPLGLISLGYPFGCVDELCCFGEIKSVIDFTIFSSTYSRIGSHDKGTRNISQGPSERYFNARTSRRTIYINLRQRHRRPTPPSPPLNLNIHQINRRSTP